MGSFTGLIYSSGTITASGNSGWLDLESILGIGTAGGTSRIAIDRATLRIVPSGLSTDETLAVEMNLAWDSAGAGDVKIHDFTSITNTNGQETVILPGDDSEALLVVATELVQAPLPAFWKFTHTLAGTTKSMAYSIYAALTWS